MASSDTRPTPTHTRGEDRRQADVDASRERMLDADAALGGDRRVRIVEVAAAAGVARSAPQTARGTG
jgi:hypothetical protein